MPEDPNKTPEDPNAPDTKVPPSSNKDDDDDEEDKPDKLSPEQQKAFDKLLAKQAKLKADLESRKTREDGLKAENATLKAAQDAAESAKLKEQGEYQKLYETESQKTIAAKERLIETELKRLAASEGILDDELVVMIARDKIKVGDDFSISGAESAVKAFKANKPSLFKQAESKETQPNPTGAKVTSPPPANGDVASGSEFKFGTPEYNKRKAEFIRTGK